MIAGDYEQLDPTNYKTKNWSHNARALKWRDWLSIWFDAVMAWEVKPSGHRRRKQAYSDRGIQACLTVKVLFGLALRRTAGFVESLLKLMGLNWSVPDLSTLCLRQKTMPVAIPYLGLPGASHLLIDSTGIKAEGQGDWNTRRPGGSKRRLWRKMHIGIDEQTREIYAVEVTSSSIGDAPMLPDLFRQIPPDHVIGCVTADGAYNTLNAMTRLLRGTPVRSSHRAKTPNCGNLTRSEPERATTIVRSSKYLGRALWRQLTGYHPAGANYAPGFPCQSQHKSAPADVSGTNFARPDFGGVSCGCYLASRVMIKGFDRIVKAMPHSRRWPDRGDPSVWTLLGFPEKGAKMYALSHRIEVATFFRGRCGAWQDETDVTHPSDLLSAAIHAASRV